MYKQQEQQSNLIRQNTLGKGYYVNKLTVIWDVQQPKLQPVNLSKLENHDKNSSPIVLNHKKQDHIRKSKDNTYVGNLNSVEKFDYMCKNYGIFIQKYNRASFVQLNYDNDPMKMNKHWRNQEIVRCTSANNSEQGGQNKKMMNAKVYSFQTNQQKILKMNQQKINSQQTLQSCITQMSKQKSMYSRVNLLKQSKASSINQKLIQAAMNSSSRPKSQFSMQRKLINNQIEEKKIENQKIKLDKKILKDARDTYMKSRLDLNSTSFILGRIAKSRDFYNQSLQSDQISKSQSLTDVNEYQVLQKYRIKTSNQNQNQKNRFSISVKYHSSNSSKILKKTQSVKIQVQEKSNISSQDFKDIYKQKMNESPKLYFSYLRNQRPSSQQDSYMSQSILDKYKQKSINKTPIIVAPQQNRYNIVSGYHINKDKLK